MRQTRQILDCRSFPNENGCSLTISGLRKEVLKAAVRHAVEEHGHKDTPELRKQLKSLLMEESKTLKPEKQKSAGAERRIKKNVTHNNGQRCS